MVFDVIIGWINDLFTVFNNNVPETYKPFVIVGFFTILIAVYAILAWVFYRFLAKRDLLELNLGQYNKSQHPFLFKIFAVLLYLLEYMIVLPLFVFLWFGILAIFILRLSTEQVVSQILLISACVVAATRLISYFNQDLSRDIAKVFPFTILAVFLIDPTSFSMQAIINSMKEIPALFNPILNYLLFVVFLESFMRLIFLLTHLSSKNKGSYSHDVPGS